MSTQPQRIADPECRRVSNEIDMLRSLLPLDGARVLELGCGAAAMTRLIAERFAVGEIVATEVDAIQHEKNLAAQTDARISFRRGGAESIDAPADSFDAVLMFKSLHHVPVAVLDRSMAEIARVLRPGGLAYISEPVYAGEFNDILRLFHDERSVREAAYAAIGRAVAAGVLQSRTEAFFLAPNRYADFAEFEQRTIKVTHTEHRLDDRLLARVKGAFERHLGSAGAEFLVPMRVNLLAKPA